MELLSCRPSQPAAMHSSWQPTLGIRRQKLPGKPCAEDLAKSALVDKLLKDAPLDNLLALLLTTAKAAPDEQAQQHQQLERQLAEQERKQYEQQFHQSQQPHWSAPMLREMQQQQQQHSVYHPADNMCLASTEDMGSFHACSAAHAAALADEEEMPAGFALGAGRHHNPEHPQQHDFVPSSASLKPGGPRNANAATATFLVSDGCYSCALGSESATTTW